MYLTGRIEMELVYTGDGEVLSIPTLVISLLPNPESALHVVLHIMVCHAKNLSLYLVFSFVRS